MLSKFIQSLARLIKHSNRAHTKCTYYSYISRFMVQVVQPSKVGDTTTTELLTCATMLYQNADKSRTLKHVSIYCPENICIYLYLAFMGYHLYSRCPLFSSFSFTSSLMHSSVYTKNFNAYDLTCVISTALKLSVVSQALSRSLGDHA